MEENKDRFPGETTIIEQIIESFPTITREEATQKVRSIPLGGSLTSGVCTMLMWAVGLHLQRKMAR